MKARNVTPVEDVVRRLSAATGRPLPMGAIARLQDVTDAFEGGTESSVQIGIMGSRNINALRIASQAIQTHAVAGVLGRIGWPGPVQSVGRIISEYHPHIARVRVAVDVSRNGVLGRLGLELLATPKSDLWFPGCRAWTPLIRKLSQDGYCLPRKARGLLAWPGRNTLFTSACTYRIHAGFSHFKLLFSPQADRREMQITAKAYGASGYFPLGTAPPAPRLTNKPEGESTCNRSYGA